MSFIGIIYNFCGKECCLQGTAAAATMTTLLTDVGSIVTQAVTWIGQFTGAITSNPLIEMFVIVSFVGLGVGLIRRLIRL